MRVYTFDLKESKYYLVHRHAIVCKYEKHSDDIKSLRNEMYTGPLWKSSERDLFVFIIKCRKNERWREEGGSI